MLKILRKGAVENPWIYRTIMFLIAATFIISMGWWGFSGATRTPYVAQIDQVRISLTEYNRYKENAYRYYRDLLKENFKEDLVKQLVINSLVERQLWLKLAREMGLSVGVDELRESITQDASFHDEQGRFDPDRYQFFLSRSHTAADEFEQSVREDLLITKAKLALQDGILLTNQETVEAKASVTDPKLTPDKRLEEETKAVEQALVRKQQRVVMSALNRVRAATRIEVKNQVL
ncbi:MAG TPA: SurA N-terminal domain-containing protein [Nitrospiria bacterium]|nr:SurA N-terminal domain-containing protein [Nitrospiria bacterium]